MTSFDPLTFPKVQVVFISSVFLDKLSTYTLYDAAI